MIAEMIAGTTMPLFVTSTSMLTAALVYYFAKYREFLKEKPN